MFAAVVREGMYVRLPSGRIAQVLWHAEGEREWFFEIEYVDNGERGVVNCRLMRHTAQPRDVAGDIIVNIKSTLDPEVRSSGNTLTLKRKAP